MFSIILVIIIIGGLLVTGGVALRHFPEVAQLDVEHLPVEKEQRKKRELITKRLEAEGVWLRDRSRVWLKPIGILWVNLQGRFRRYVRRIEKLWHHEKTLRAKQQPELAPVASADLAAQLKRATEALARGEWEGAELSCIAAIKLDQTNAEAYRALAQSYTARELWEEAKQTYLFLTKLAPDDDKVYAALGEIAEAEGNTQEAIEHYQEAVVLNDALSPRFYHLAELLLKVNQPAVAREAIISALGLEPKNPKFLDLLLETAILMSDKEEAEEVYAELRLVNPDNNKLAEFKERINKL